MLVHIGTCPVIQFHPPHHSEEYEVMFLVTRDKTIGTTSLAAELYRKGLEKQKEELKLKSAEGKLREDEAGRSESSQSDGGRIDLIDQDSDLIDANISGLEIRSMDPPNADDQLADLVSLTDPMDRGIMSETSSFASEDGQSTGASSELDEKKDKLSETLVEESCIKSWKVAAPLVEMPFAQEVLAKPDPMTLYLKFYLILTSRR